MGKNLISHSRSSFILFGRILFAYFLGLSLGYSPAFADEVTVAVASNFITPMQKLVADFEQKSEHSITLVSGSSGRFYAQISHGAPFDLLLSADSDKPARLINDGLALPSNLFTYAYGRLVLWTAEAGQVVNEKTLSNAEFTHLAIANSKLAPYGKAAKEVLTQLGLAKATRSRWVVGENISQTYQFVVSQNARYGFIAASQWQGQGSGWLIPEALHQPIQQDAIVLNRAKDKQAVFELVEYLQSPAAAVIIQDYGYQVSPASSIHTR
jgi:molybdate transport system substrate-binding protein